MVYFVVVVVVVVFRKGGIVQICVFNIMSQMQSTLLEPELREQLKG